MNFTDLKVEVVGNKKSLEVFSQWIKNTVDLFDDTKCLKPTDVEKHISSSILSVDSNEFIITECENGESLMHFSGENKGSAVDGFLANNKSKYDPSYISVKEACEILNLKCEIFCFDEGVCVVEHYIIDNKGQLVCEEGYDCEEFYLDDYDEYEDFIEENEDSQLDEEAFEEYKDSGYYRECEIWNQEELDWLWKLNKKGGE